MEFLADKNRSSRKGFSKYLSIEEVPEEFIKLLLFSEDRDFFKHKGISIKAIMRSIIQNLKNLKIVSGGSTITQQLVKAKKGIVKNNIFTKILELIEAI